MWNQWQTADIPFVGGLNTKADPRAMQPPELAVCRNAEFDETGGVQTRKPYAEILDHASNTIADIRKIVPYGDELVAFSKDKLWSYADGDGLWTERAEYLAVKIEENARFVTTGEQFDCDTAQLGGVTMYCWTETTPSGTESYIAAIDTASGAVKLSPEIIKADAVRPKLLATTNRLALVYFVDTGGVDVLTTRFYDPSDLSDAGGTANVTNMNAIDAIVDPATPTRILIAFTVQTTLWGVYEAAEDAAPTSLRTRAVTVGTACSIAWDTVSDDGILVMYNNGTAVKADLIDATGTDVALDIAVGTAASSPVNQLACVFDGVDDFRCFWSAGETTASTSFQMETNTVDSAGSPGTEADVVLRCGLASRAFLHDGNVYVWGAFAAASEGALTGQLQNSYLLFRVDGFLVAKAVATQAGGHTASTGNLPGVQNTGGSAWAWCGQYRRIVPLGKNQKGYAAKSPQQVVFTFDSDEARRSARLGETLYIAGGQISQYDGRGVVEVGFHIFPFALSIVPAAGTGLSAATYNWQQTYSWDNAKGEKDFSSTATIYTDGPFAGPNLQANIQAVQLNVTAKTGSNGEAASKIWRTIGDAPVFAPFYLVTSKDPASTGDNDYVENDPTAAFTATMSDEMSDADLLSKETHPENGGLTLANLTPPAATIIIATQDRILLAGIPGLPNTVAYSKLRGSGEVAAFNDRLTVDLPPEGGAITALVFLNETLIAFCETAIYSLPGDGFDNNGGGQNYGPARILNSDVGAESAEAVALTPLGVLFKSAKGWYLLNHGGSARYVGKAVVEFDGEPVLSVHPMLDQHQVRCMTASRILVWDYLEEMSPWSEWTVSGGVSACIFGETYHYSDGAKVFSEQDDWSAWNGPLVALDGVHGVAETTIDIIGDVSEWPDPLALMFSRGLAAEEVKQVASIDSSTQMTLGPDSLDNSQADGVDVELSYLGTQSGAISVGDTTLVMATANAAKMPTSGYALLGYDTANVETVTFLKVSTTNFTISAATKTHSHGDDVVVIAAESQGLDLETGWIKLAGLQGFAMLRRIFLLGEYLGAHAVRMRVAYDYKETAAGPVWVDDKTWTVSPTVPNGPLQMEHGPSRPKCEAFKLRITLQAENSTLAPLVEAAKLTGLSIEFGVEPTAYRGLPVAQTQ